MPPIGETAQAKPFIKRKVIDKGDHPPKKLKGVAATTVGEMLAAAQVPPSIRHGTGKA